MNIKDLSTQLLYTTVPIWVQRTDGKQSSGTGFIYMHPTEKKGSSIPFLITSYHVLENAEKILVEFAVGSEEGPDLGKSVKIELPIDKIRLYHDSENDISGIVIGPILNQVTDQKILFRSISPDIIPSKEVINDLAAVEEITFIGYPSGLFDEHNISPIIRRGITASPVWNDFDGEPKFLIDAGVYPGSSGSPVFIMNQGSYATKQGITMGSRLLFLGIISESIIRMEHDKQSTFLGLGKVIKSSIIKIFIDDVVKDLR